MPSSTTPTTVVEGDAVRTAANLGAEATRARAVPAEDIQAGLVVRVLKDGERIDVTDLEHTLGAPYGPRGTAVIWEPADFVSYVNRLADAATTVWANPDAAMITAVFDDHTDSHTGGWRRHRANLVVRRDPEWQAWLGRSGVLGSQEEFAEHLEDHYGSVVDPDAATMLEIATSFQAHRNSSFERGTRLQSGDVQLRYSDTTQATAGSRGHLDVPETFTVSVAPFLGVAPVDIKARLRYRITEGRLRIGYVLHRPDLAEREAFDRIRADVIAGISVDAHLGEAPAQLHPHSVPTARRM